MSWILFIISARVGHDATSAMKLKISFVSGGEENTLTSSSIGFEPAGSTGKAAITTLQTNQNYDNSCCVNGLMTLTTAHWPAKGASRR